MTAKFLYVLQPKFLCVLSVANEYLQMLWNWDTIDACKDFLLVTLTITILDITESHHLWAIQEF